MTLTDIKLVRKLFFIQKIHMARFY